MLQTEETATKTADEKENEAETEKNDCPICYLPISETDLCKLPCGHAYHSECLRQNYNSTGKQRICPYCRTSYPIPPSMQPATVAIGDWVAFTVKRNQKVLQMQGQVTKLMPNTVYVQSPVGSGHRVDRQLLTKIEGFKIDGLPHINSGGNK